VCRNDGFLDFAGLVGEGVGDVVTVVAVAVAVGDEGVDDVVGVVPGVGGYCY